MAGESLAMFASPPESFRAPIWARGPHAQTILGALLPSPARPYGASDRAFRAVEIELSDGDRLAARYARGSRGTTAVLLHGLGGSASSAYVRRAAQAAASRGFGVLAVDQRGCGEGRDLATLPYMTGRTEDVSDVLRWLRAEAPDDRVLAVGYSLSGNTLLGHLGRGTGELPDCALCVSPAVDLDATSRALLRWPARAYDLWILRACRRWIPRLRGRGPDPPRYRVPPLSSLREFDRRYIAPVSGFASREEYYAQASSAPWLTRIEVPTVILAAADDPIVDVRQLTHARRSPRVALHVEPRGGHLGYLTDRPTTLGSRRWLDHALLHYLEAAARYRAAPPSPRRSPRQEVTRCAP